jgi:CRISPR-associated protein Cmr2
MNYLFLVTIGPVQEFIASARRTRDLHFGSWFLSELSRSAAYEINAQKGILIFPAPENMAWLQPNQPFNVANRILALIEQEPGDLAVQVQAAVYRRLHEIRDEAYKGIALFGKWREVAYAQIDDLVELMWVSLPYYGNYREVRKPLEELMAARKNTYAFRPVAWGKNVPKSSLDGQLESVIPEDEYPPRDATAAVKLHQLQRLYNRYGVAGQAERLSGVDLLKRSGRTAFESHFPSTSHIAALPFLQRMERIDASGKLLLHSAWNDYVKKLETLAIIPLREQISHTYSAYPILDRNDGALLFEGRLADVLGIPSTDTTLNEKLLQARDELQAFYRLLDEQFSRVGLRKARPSTYYALLQADGDSMGDLIDALAEQGDAPAKRGYEQHRSLSQALSRFAENVRKIVVEDHQGALVYAGGDDVLAFLPLHTVLACAVDLKTRFHDALKDLATQLDRQPPTLSVGIAIVHHLDSLREARRLAHDAEQQAKRENGKNALAIIVSKRSGEDYRVVGRWGNIDVRLSQLVAYCRAASLPVGMAYELRDLVLRLSIPTTDSQDETLQDVIRLDTLLSRLVAYCRAASLPVGIAYELRDLVLRPSIPTTPQQDETLQDVIRLDTLRILLRKLKVPAGKLPPQKIEEIEAFLRVQLDLPPKEKKGEQDTSPIPEETVPPEEKGEQSHPPPVSVETFINELIIAQMLAEAAELAQEGVKP